jgi:hypothetical protein
MQDEQRDDCVRMHKIQRDRIQCAMPHLETVRADQIDYNLRDIQADGIEAFFFEQAQEEAESRTDFEYCTTEWNAPSYKIEHFPDGGRIEEPQVGVSTSA